MKHKKLWVGAVCALFGLLAHAGGNPEFVKFPAGYQSSFTNYTTMNRADSDAVAKMYANRIALSSYRKGQPAAPGSIVIMEVYKPKMDASGKPVVGSNGVNEIDKRAAWPGGFADSDRPGNWGFAIYNADGSRKDNDLDCVGCHAPLKNQDYLFSRQWLIEFAKR
jgi:hypothetical protein